MQNIRENSLARFTETILAIDEANFRDKPNYLTEKKSIDTVKPDNIIPLSQLLRRECIPVKKINPNNKLLNLTNR